MNSHRLSKREELEQRINLILSQTPLTEDTFNQLFYAAEEVRGSSFTVTFCVQEKEQHSVCHGDCERKLPRRELIKLQQCDNHLYCFQCARNYAYTCLNNDPNMPVYCQACTRDPTLVNCSALTLEELNSLVSIEEQRAIMEQFTLINTSAYCTGYSTCPLNSALHCKSDMISFTCGEYTCMSCYALYFQATVENEYNAIHTDLESKNGKQFFFKCLNGHDNSAMVLSLENLQCVNSYTTPENNRNSMNYVLAFPNYFTRGNPLVAKQCVSCRQILECEDPNNMECIHCGKCIDCGSSSHSGFKCQESAFFSSSYDMEQEQPAPEITDESPFALNFNKIAGIFLDNKSPMKLQSIIKVENKVRRDFLNKLKQAHDNCKVLSVTSEYFTNQTACDKVYNGLDKDNFGYVSFPLKFVAPTNSKPCFITMQIYYLGSTVQGKPTQVCDLRNPKLYEDGTKYYCPGDACLLLSIGTLG